MRYFGWLPAGGLRSEMMPTPVGAVCAWCGEPVAEGDLGVEVPHIGSAGNALEVSLVYFHRECQVRMIFGSIGHMEGRCGCGTGLCGEGETDPSGISLREAARLACARFDSIYGGRA